MPEAKEPAIRVPIGGFDVFKIVGAVIALALAWGTMDARVQAQASSLQAQSALIADHEVRMRSMENLVLVAVGELKGDMKSEFHGLKIRVTSLEKALEKAGSK